MTIRTAFYVTTIAFLSLQAAAQTAGSDTTFNKAAVSVCDCLTKANIDDKSTQEQMQQAFLNCIFTSAPDLITKIVSSGQDYQTAGEQMGTQLAMAMMKNGCPAFTKIAAGMAMNNSDSSADYSNGNDQVVTAPPIVATVQTAAGTVIKIEERDFTYITIKTAAGREQTFIYLDYVPGSDDWVKDAAVKLKDKNVTIGYVENEVYQPKYKQFMNVREIKNLTIK